MKEIPHTFQIKLGDLNDRALHKFLSATWHPRRSASAQSKKSKVNPILGL